MELHISTATTRRPKHTTGHPTITPNGMDRIATFFCAATETGWDTAIQYTETLVGSCSDHKFLHMTQGSPKFEALPPECSTPDDPLRYLIEVYMDDYIGLAIPTPQAQLNHISNSIMCVIHEIFPTDDSNVHVLGLILQSLFEMRLIR